MCQPTYMSSNGRHVNRYISRVAVDISSEISIDVCTKIHMIRKMYSRHLISYCGLGSFLLLLTPIPVIVVMLIEMSNTVLLHCRVADKMHFVRV